jgi:REP element-mobilizing transposase RayT
MQRGNRRERTCSAIPFDRLCRDPLGIAAAKAGAEIRAYGLMPNHVHAVVTAKDEKGLWRFCTGVPPVTSMRATVGPGISGHSALDL